MKRKLAFAALALSAACSYAPPGSCTVDSDCGAGLSCTSEVCVACPAGICPAIKVIPATGGAVSLYTTPFSTFSSLTANFPAGSVPAGTTAQLVYVPFATVPAPNPRNVYVTAFELKTDGVTQFSSPIRVSGINVSTLHSSTVLIVAKVQPDGSWVDTITAVTGGASGFRTLRPSTKLPGILGPGKYVAYLPARGSSTVVADFGVALCADDGSGVGLQVISLYDDDGAVLATPSSSALRLNGGDLDGASLTPDGSQGVLVDGANLVDFFSDVGSGFPTESATEIDIANYGGDGDAIAVLPNGDEAIVSGDTNSLVVISGIVGAMPRLAIAIPLPDTRDGLVMSNDGRVLLARGQTGLTVFSVASVPSSPGPLGGNTAHSFTQTGDFPNALNPTGEDGRDGMGCDPADSSRAVIVGNGSIQMLTGLPGSPTLGSVLPIAGVNQAFAISLTEDGQRAIVGTNAGLVMFTGVDTGSLQQTGAPFNPGFTVGGQRFTLASAGVPTLGITLDGKYVVVMTGSGNGVLLTIPIQANGFGAPVGQLNGVSVPNNDQILMH